MYTPGGQESCFVSSAGSAPSIDSKVASLGAAQRSAPPAVVMGVPLTAGADPSRYVVVNDTVAPSADGTKPSPAHVVFVGAGAVGCFYASRLHHVSGHAFVRRHVLLLDTLLTHHIAPSRHPHFPDSALQLQGSGRRRGQAADAHVWRLHLCSPCSISLARRSRQVSRVGLHHRDHQGASGPI
jgi:hypothetical protein